MKYMDLYYSKTYSDEDGVADTANSGLIFGSKEELLKICEFFAKVKSHLAKNDNCHMHLCDDFENWEKGKHFDIEVTISDE
jgi:hypothetical protein